MPLIGSFGSGSARGFGRGGGKAPYFVQFLIAAGGGGGGFYVGAGGGAGGYVAGTNKLLTIGETYTVTVGAPGPDSGGVLPYYQGGNGGNSSLTGETTAIGGGAGSGGYGGGGTPGLGSNGTPGGSGGGTGGQAVPLSYVGGTGVPGQGFPGGDHTVNAKGGAGGGATSAGGPSGSQSLGYGAYNSITGSPVYYCAGGTYNPGLGTPGPENGMPNGPYSPPWDVQKADPAYFGGTGHGGRPDKYAGASGGVYLRIETKNLNTEGLTGSYISSVDGDYTVLQYTGSGSYVA